MSSVKISWSQAPAPLPAGQTWASLKLTLVDSTGAQQTSTVTDPTLTALQFDNVADGSVTVTSQALDTTGAVLGAPQTLTFTAPVTGGAAGTFPQVSALTASAV